MQLRQVQLSQAIGDRYCDLRPATCGLRPEKGAISLIALAVTDRALARSLFAAGALDIDYLETGGYFVERTAAEFPGQTLLLHNSLFNWSLGHPAALEQQEAVPRTLETLALTRAPWLSVHLGFSAAEVEFDEGMQAKTPTLPRDELFANICRNVRTLAAAIPVPLILENLDYLPSGAYEHICEPEFIAAVLAETGAGLLLDLAHARVSAARLGMPIDEYLTQLPLDRVRQIHVSGPRPRDGILADAHEPLLDEDYALLRDVLRRTAPQALTLEYFRDEAALQEQISRLRELLHE
jgi:uncharacterized protein (UPF0276 family)